MQFLDTSFTKFEWRNIGLIVLMCYEWGQRPVDIRNLKWDSVDLDKRVVTITQSKRGAVVELPIPDNIFTMLSEQKDDWDFQEYVVPHHRASDRAYRPLTVNTMTALLAEVKATAGLPEELRVGDLRKTAIVQMIESGVDHLAIQSVSGHKSVSSLNPYNKFSLKTAKSALDRRQRE
jgi:integrase